MIAVRRPWAAAFVALPTIGACALWRCNGGGDDGDASVDAHVDAVTKDVSDAGADVNIACNDASQGTRWAGWSRVTEADPCCTVEVPDQVDASVAPLTWIPCTNDAGGCTEMPITWGVQPNWTRFISATVTPATAPRFVNVTRQLDSDYAEIDWYSFGDGTSVAAWRDYVTPNTVWTAEPFGGDTSVWVFVAGTRDVNVAGVSLVAHADIVSGALHPTPFNVVPSSALVGSGMQDFFASDTTLAFDTEPAGRIGRTSAAAPGAFIFTPPSMTGLIFPLVHGDDVFAECPGCNGGWAEEYKINSDGSTVVLRAQPNRHVANFAADGTTLYWTESYGAGNFGLQQPNTEVWTAPYTSDPATLTATAKKIANANGANAYDNSGIAFQGYYAIITAASTATVIRASDGAVNQAVAGAGRAFAQLAYASAAEVWALMVDPSLNVPGAEFFQRQALGPWL